MATFDLSNPVFAAYAATAAVLVLKMASMSWLTVYRMMKTRSGFRSPEDAQAGALNPDPRPGQLDRNEYVERIRRIHQNDLENLPPFLAIGLVYVATAPAPALAQGLFALYAVSRLVHFAAYLTARSHELRAALWTTGSLVMLYMAGASAMAALRTLGLLS
jgi:glutathione S-transferase